MKIRLLIFGILLVFITTVEAHSQTPSPPSTYPQASCQGTYVVDRRFNQQALDSWWGSPRPPFPFEAYTTRLWQGNIQELVFVNSNVWLRTGTGGDVNSLQGKVWQSFPLSQAWGNTTNPPPSSGITAAAYRVYNGKFSEIIIVGTTIWYRETIAPDSYQFETTWRNFPTSQAWGNTQNPPSFTSPVDEYAYRALDGNVEELVVQGGTLYRRIGTTIDANSVPPVWQRSQLADIWKNVAELPTSTPAVLNYQLAGGKLREVMILSDTYYSRDCVPYPDMVYDSSLGMINTFLRYYSDNTDYSAVIDSDYTDGHIAGQAFRSLIANALTHTARYQLSQNQQDKDKALFYLRSSINNFQKWQESWLSGIVTRDTLLVGWYWWNSLTTQERDVLLNVAVTQSNYLTNIFRLGQKAYASGDFDNYYYTAITGYVNDTKAEENNAAAEALAFASQLFAEHPDSLLWEYYARCYAYHTITRSIDPLRCFVKTQTVYDDFTLDNHDLHPSPVYTLAAIAGLQQGEFAYTLAGKSLPAEFRHNIASLWTNFHTYYIPYPQSPPMNSFMIRPEFHPGEDWGDTHVALAAAEAVYTAVFGGGNSETDFSDLSRRMVTFFDDWWYNKFIRYDEPIAVVSMPKYTQTDVTLRWFGNGLLHGKGAAEQILYHEAKNGRLQLKRTTRSPQSKKNILSSLYSMSANHDFNGSGKVNVIDIAPILLLE